MTQRAVSLMDILMPPGNDWLREISRRRTELPAGVHVVRFSDAEEELTDDAEGARTSGGRQAKMAA